MINAEIEKNLFMNSYCTCYNKARLFNIYNYSPKMMFFTKELENKTYKRRQLIIEKKNVLTSGAEKDKGEFSLFPLDTKFTAYLFRK